jgi:crotonobetainyl-CoA:carnitine CoA-transferase CaiB-like acyl-CoA transferase
MFRSLVEGAEVVVETFPPGYLTDLRLGYESLASIKPRLVMTSVTPFGQIGPYAGYKATNLTTLAASGQMAVSGESTSGIPRNGGHQAEYQAGLHAFAATAVAAFNADATEVGQHIDVAAMECLATMPEPAPGMRSLRELLEAPRLKERGFFQEIDNPIAGRQTYPGPPFRPEAMPWQTRRAPLLGEHNEEVYCGDLELSREELVVLRASGVI